MSHQSGSWWGACLAIGLIASSGVAQDDEETSPGVERDPIATVEPDVIYGRVDALAMTYDLLKPTAEANGAISMLHFASTSL